jgi:membrane protease YdiL (CAAX protease family)
VEREHIDRRKNEVTVNKSDLKAATILVSSTLLLVASHYHRILGDDTLSSFVFYFLIPLGIILLAFREDPRRFGLRLGNWRQGALWAVLGILLMAMIIVGLAQLAEFRSYYASLSFQEPLSHEVVEFALRQAIYMFSWEFIFRGFMLFGLKDRLGPLAIWIQAIPFAIMHLGKPELETLSTIFGGAAFGYIDLKSKSVLPSVIIHWAIYVMMVFAASNV